MVQTATERQDRAGAIAAPRLVPVQKRSRERFERILSCAAEIITEKGSDAFKMSDIVARAKVPFGSLYQYFPDKTAVIATLAERYNAIGRECVRRDLATVHMPEDVHPALCRIVDSYYQMFLDEPLMRDIWQATQADRVLQKIDAEDGAYLAQLLVEALARAGPGRAAEANATFAQLMMTLMAAAVRTAIALPQDEAKRSLALFKRLLPRNMDAI